MANRINGNDLQLYYGTAETRATTTTGAAGERLPLAHAQTVSLEVSNSLIDVTTKASNSWKEMISGQKSFTLSADGLVDDYTASSPITAREIGDAVTANGSNISSVAINGTRLYFEFGVGNSRFTGSGFISSFSQTGGTDDAPTYSVSIESTGALAYDDDVTS